MKIRKSRLKQIIKEEVDSFKFIPINEAVAPEKEKRVLQTAITQLQVLASADNILGLEHDANGILASVIDELQSLMNPVSEESSPASLLDEIVVQEIVKALSEDEETDEASEAEAALATSLEEGEKSHTHQARALQQKAKAGPLGHNDQAALDYHLAQAEKEGK